MARPVRGIPIIIKREPVYDPDDPSKIVGYNPPWAEHEWVQARTLFTAGDRQWINAHGVRSIIDQSTPDGMRREVDEAMLQLATIAKMTIKWTLTQDETDATGEVVYGDMGSKPRQIPIDLPDNLEARIRVIQEKLHEQDVAEIANQIQSAAPQPRTEQESKAFLTSSAVPTSAS